MHAFVFWLLVQNQCAGRCTPQGCTAAPAYGSIAVDSARVLVTFCHLRRTSMLQRATRGLLQHLWDSGI